MIRDVKSSMLLAEHISAKSRTVATVNGTAVDHSLGNSCSYLISAGLFGTSAVLNVKLQYSDDNSSWTDEDGASGNGTAITALTAAGSAQLDIVNPQGRYSRCVAVNTVEAVDYSIVSVLGPRRTIVPS